MRKIYELMDIADSAYIMHSGKLILEISHMDRYYLEGNEIIFGAEEPLIAYKLNREDYFRFQTVYVEDRSSVEKIPLENLYKVISIYNIGYTIAKNIAKFVEITNKIFVKKEQEYYGKEMASKEYARLYVDIIDKLKAVYLKMKNKWLNEIIERYSDSLVFTKGLSFKKSAAKSDLKLQMDELQDYTVNANAGAILCEEGDQGNEMFILNRGNLEVYIGGKKVTTIHEGGTVIGEMALLLGEKRTATIKALTDCNITIIKPENLKEIAQSNEDFFLNVSVNMGKRLEHNCGLIRETNELLVNSDVKGQHIPPKERTNYREVLSLIDELEKFESKYKFEWLSEILNYARKEMTYIRDTFK